MLTYMGLTCAKPTCDGLTCEGLTCGGLTCKGRRLRLTPKEPPVSATLNFDGAGLSSRATLKAALLRWRQEIDAEEDDEA